MATETLSTPEVCRLAGVSYRELDYWERAGVVRPSLGPAQGSGSHRLWSPSDVADVALVAVLRAAGVGLTRCGSAVRVARGAEERWLVVATGPGPVFVVAEGDLEAALGICPGAVVADLAAVRAVGSPPRSLALSA